MNFSPDDAASATPTAYTPSHSLFATSENCSSFSHSETVHHFLISHFDFEISFENCAGKKKNVVKWLSSESSPRRISDQRRCERHDMGGHWATHGSWSLSATHCHPVLTCSRWRIAAWFGGCQGPGGRNCKCRLRSMRQLSWSEPKKITPGVRQGYNLQSILDAGGYSSENGHDREVGKRGRAAPNRITLLGRILDRGCVHGIITCLSWIMFDVIGGANTVL